MIDPRIVVEDAFAYLPTPASTVRLDAGDVVLRHSPHSPHYWYGSATRPRFSEATLEQRVAEIRGWFGDLGRHQFMWMVGDSASPPGLVDRLVASGARPSEDPDADAMILDHEPPPAPPGIAIRRIETFADYAASRRIAFEDATPEAWATTESGLGAAWAEARSDDQTQGFLALEAGTPVGAAQLVWLSNGLPYLGGATTLREARGRGAFRALVRTRWDEAARRGTSVLLVQAGRMSAPILEGLGFRTVGHVRTLVDVIR
jgi:hypothetical protein